MTQERNLNEYEKKIIREEIIWLKHYIGEIINIVDPLNKGRVQVKIYDLIIDMEGKSDFWCVPRDKNSISVPRQNDWVEVYFVNGDKNRPVYLGIANEMKDMLPKNFDGNNTTHVIFESPNNKIHILFDERNNIMNIGNSNFQPAARKNDATLSTSSEDSAFWAFIDNIVTIFNSHVHPAPGGTTSATTTPFTGKPTQMVGKINAGSDQINIGNK